MKTFDSLFSELTEKARTRPEGSGTVRELDAGIHTIGKKIVEEAAEVWMAAEYETDAEAERLDLAGALAGVQQQVAAGDAHVQRAGGHVGGDVAGAQVEELDVVGLVDQVELLGVAAGRVAGLGQHLDGGLREGPLVGDGDAEHVCFRVGVCDVSERERLRDVGRRPPG